MYYVVFNYEIDNIEQITERFELIYPYLNKTDSVVVPVADLEPDTLNKDNIKAKADAIKASQYSTVLSNALYLEFMFNYYDFLISLRFKDLLKERGYTSIVSCISYENDANPKFKAEAKYVQKMRSEIYTLADQIRNEVLAGTRQIPTMEEFVALMPVLSWTNVEY